LLLLLVACAALAVVVAFSTLQPTTQTQPPTQRLAKLRVSFQPSMHHVAYFVMSEKGWLRVLGVEVEEREFPTGPPQMEAFAAGALDVAYVGAAPPLSIIAKGARAKIVAVANTEGSSIVVRPGLEYTGPQSLVGKKVGCYPPGSIQDTLLRKWLRENGIDPDKDLQIVVQGPREQMESLRAGAIDAAFLPDPHPQIAALRGLGRVAINSGQMWPNHPCCVVLVSEDLIAKHRDVVVKFIALHVIASEYVTKPENREDVLRILMKRLGIEKGEAETFPGTTRFTTDPRDPAWLEGLDYMCRVHYELGLTKDPEGRVVRLRASQIVDVTLYEEALKLVPQIKAQLGLR